MNLYDKRSKAKQNLQTIISTEPLWTVEDVANYLRLKPETVRTMARDGKLPSIKVGRGWRFSAKEVNDWVIKRVPQNKY
jgi:excisionase family DNA binding protein